METEDVLAIFNALGQATRLEVFKLLIEHEPTGLAAGDIARHLKVPHNTMSTHLGVLARAKLIDATRQSRSIIYRARLGALQKLIGYLLTDCCGGKPEICVPILATMSPSCAPKSVEAVDD
jgi:ArsR family transcriptional regulator, arsenate/arsenite/antimonite-responsive transcriptional repressor